MTPSTDKTILVTGGAGFIGGHFVRWLLAHDERAQIVNLDKLTYAGNLESLRDVLGHPRHRFVRGDICDPATVAPLVGEADLVVNFAAESHVDRSIDGPRAFLDTNVTGTLTLLEAVRAQARPIRFVQVSTDEVYGSLGPTGAFTEESPLLPNSPYSASKAAADLLVRAFHHTYGVDAVVTRCSNNYGPYQFPEKLIPLMIRNARADRPLPVYGDGGNVRDWIHVSDHVRGVWAAATRGRAGEIYNFGGGNERANLTIIRALLALLGKPERLISFVKDRPGHDRRYAIDATKAHRELGWAPEIDFDEGLRETVAWYEANDAWVASVTTGEYQRFYERWYAER